MKSVTTFFFLFIAASLFSQSGNNEFDALLLQLKQAKEDTNKVNILFNLSEVCEIKDVLKYAEEAYTLAEKLNYKKGMANSLNNIAYSYNNDGDAYKALIAYKKSQKIREEMNDPSGIAQSLNNVGDIYESQAEIIKALGYYQKALVIQEKINDHKGITTTLDHIGSVYRSLGNLTIAMEYYKRSLSYSEKNNDLAGIQLSYNNIGLVYIEQKNFSKALYCYKKSEAILEKIGDQVGLARAYNNIAAIYIDSKEQQRALDYLEKSLAITERINYRKGTVLTLNGISLIYYDRHDFKKALEYASHAHEMSTESGSPFFIKATSKNLSNIYEAIGDYKKALQMHTLYMQMAFKMNNQETQKVSLQMEFNKKEEKLKSDQEKKDAISRQEKQQQKLILICIIVFLLSLIIFTAILFNRFKTNQRQKKIIEEKNHEILDSIKYAKRIQTAILATEEQIKRTFSDSFLFYLPKDIVAGDFYFFETTNTHIFYAAADCTGHGVPGALVSVACSNALLRCVNEYKLTLPGQILDKARELVIDNFKKSGQEVKDGMDISLMAIDKLKFKPSKQLTINWAGANNSLVYTSNGQIAEIKANKQPIGQVDNPLPFNTHTLELNEGDCLYLYTDGFADQFGGAKGKKFKHKQLKEMLWAISNKPANEQILLLTEAFAKWKGTLDQVDDVCVIGIKL